MYVIFIIGQYFMFFNGFGAEIFIIHYVVQAKQKTPTNEVCVSVDIKVVETLLLNI